MFCPATDPTLEQLPVAGIEVVVLWTYIGEVETLGISLIAPAEVCLGCEMALIPSGAGIVLTHGLGTFSGEVHAERSVFGVALAVDFVTGELVSDPVGE